MWRNRFGRGFGPDGDDVISLLLLLLFCDRILSLFCRLIFDLVHGLNDEW